MKVDEDIKIGDHIKIINNDNDEDIIEGKIYKVEYFDENKIVITNEKGYLGSIDKEFIDKV